MTSGQLVGRFVSGKALARVLALFGFVAWACVVLAWWFRVPVGVSNGDEAFYSAMPYSFVLGSRAYLDELSFQQNAALLQVPFFRVYVWLRGSTDGIIVFNRWLYVLYLLFCSTLTYRFASRVTTRMVAAWAAALVMPVAYFNLPALGYNTLGALGFFAGVLLSALSTFDAKPGPRLFVAGLFFLSAVFDYPTLAPAVLTQAAAVAFHFSKESRASFRSALRGLLSIAFLSLVLGAVFLGYATPAGLRRALEFSQSDGHASGLRAAKFFALSKDTRNQLAREGLFALLFVALPWLLARLRSAVFVLVVALPALLALINGHFDYGAPINSQAIFLTSLAPLAPASLLVLAGIPHRRRMLSLVWLPGIVSTIAAVVTSLNGWSAAHLMALPLLVAGVIGVGLLGQQLALRDHAPLRYQAPVAAFFAAMLVLEVHSNFDNVYDDDTPEFGAHDTRVRWGPFQGALATPFRAQQLEQMDRDLKQLASDDKTLAVFDNMSGAYLSTRLRPRSMTHWITWMYQPAYRKTILRKTYAPPEQLPDFVLIANRGLRARHPWAPFRKNYSPVIARPELKYRIEQILPKIRGQALPDAAPPRTSL